MLGNDSGAQNVDQRARLKANYTCACVLDGGRALEALEKHINKKWHGFSAEFVRRFWNLQQIIFPHWKDVNILLFIALLCMQLLEQVLIYNVGLIASVYYEVLGNRDFAGFMSHTIYSLLLVSGIAIVKALSTYISSVFYVCSRDHVTKHLHSLYFRDVLYYHVNVTDPFVDNPDQRITQDVDKMCNNYSQIVGVLLLSPFTIAYYTYKTWINTGYIGPLCVFVFFIISSLVTKLLMSPVVELVHEQQRLEGDFRYKHMHIRSNSESAAFYRAGRIEQQKTNIKLNRLLKTQQFRVYKELFLNTAVNFCNYFGSILSYIILAIPIFAGNYDNLSPSEIAGLISANAFIVMYLINCFTQLLDMSVPLSEIAGTTHRISILMERLESLDSHVIRDTSSCAELDAVDASQYDPLLNVNVTNSITSLEPINTAYRLEGVSYSPPNSDRILVQELNLQVVAGVNLLITGGSGCGKSSLLRVLDGLWSITSGNIDKQVYHGRDGVIFLPQKPFLTNGSLRDQIIYPSQMVPTHAVTDVEIVSLLKQTELSHLITRLGSLDTPSSWNWCEILSPGEMQRLSFVRLFFHRPPIAILDEATSQIGVEMEKLLYEKCRELQITVISVGHRDSLRYYHDMELHLNADASWTLTDIDSEA